MSWKPSIKLYAADGSTLIYTFEYVIDLPDWIKDIPDYIKLVSLRSQGSIIIPGGNKDYEFRVRGILRASHFTDLTEKMFNLQDKIVNNKHYILKIDKSISQTDNLNVQRLNEITWEGPSKRTNLQYYTVTFLANSW